MDKLTTKFDTDVDRTEVEVQAAEAKLLDLKLRQYLSWIDQSGTVVTPFRNQSHVMMLLEEGWINHNGERYYITEKGRSILDT